MLTFNFSGAEGSMTVPEVLTTGMVGRQVMLEFSPEWEGLSKTVVFSDGVETRDLVFTGNPVTLPAQVLEQPLRRLTVGVWGVGAEGTVVIPTVRALGPVILPGVALSGDPAQAADPEIWEQILALIGDLAELETKARENVVAAINELFRRPGGSAAGGIYYIPSVSPEGVLSWRNNMGAPNPSPVNLMGPAGADGYTPVRGTDYWTEADKAEIHSYVDEAILGGAW